MAEERIDNTPLEERNQASELEEGELDAVSGGVRIPGRGSDGCKQCRNCGARYQKASRKCPLCGSTACTIVSFR